MKAVNMPPGVRLVVAPDPPKYPVNTILHTKDGRRIGNAFIIDHETCSIELVAPDPTHYNVIKTDYGVEARLSDAEIAEFFHPPVYEVEGDIPGEKHKYYVDQPFFYSIPYTTSDVEKALPNTGGSNTDPEEAISQDKIYSILASERSALRGLSSENSGMQLLSFLLEHKLTVEAGKNITERTIGELVLMCLNPMLTEWDIDDKVADKVLKRVGMKVRGDHFIIDSNNVMIHELLKDTDWKINYHNALLGIPEMQPLPHEYFASGFAKQAVGIHKNVLFRSMNGHMPEKDSSC